MTVDRQYPSTVCVCRRSDWIRDAQRFPVLIDIVDFDEAAELRLRAGGQASVMIYSSDKPFINALGHLMLRLSGYLSYLY